MNKYDAVNLACQVLRTNGFEQIAKSKLSEARYFKRPGSPKKIRVASHHQSRKWDRNVSIDVMFGAGDRRPHIKMDEAEVRQKIRAAIEKYDRW